MKIGTFLLKNKQVFNQLSHYWIFSIANKIVLLACVMDTGLIFWKWNLIPPQIPLWYYKAWGAERLADKAILFIFPISIFSWHLINTIVSINILSEHRIFVQILLFTSAFIATLCTISIIKIIFMVI